MILRVFFSCPTLHLDDGRVISVGGAWKRWGVGLAVSAGLILGMVGANAAATTASRSAAQKTWKKAVKPTPVRARKAAPPAPERLSYGQVAGLHRTDDALNLKSSSVLVLEQETGEVLFSKNSAAVLPIASITKLMTAMVVNNAGLPMDEELTISQDDVDTEKGSRSRLQVGTRLTRGEMLHLALMSSENRAASALGRHYPGGPSAFVAAMNAKAAELGMHDTRFVEATGLSSQNQSSAQDLALLVMASAKVPMIASLSTSRETEVAVGRRQLQYRNTNALVRDDRWQIELQKTGYISEAGRCLVMQAKLAGRSLVMVLLDSAGKYSRLGDAERIRRWVGGLEVSGLVPDLQPR